MNEAHVHLIINHAPLFSMLFGLLILGWGLWKKNKHVKNIAFMLFIIGGITSYIALETGEGAEEIVEKAVTSISHDAIHDHEEAAEISLWFSAITGVLGLAGLFLSHKNLRLEKAMLGILIVTAVAALGMLAYTAYEGGKIRHPEAYATVEKSLLNNDE